MPLLENGTIVINEWADGIGESAQTGFAMMRNVDIHDPENVLKIAKAPTKISSTTVTDLITWITADVGVATDYYMGGHLDTKVYKLASDDTFSSVSGVSSVDKQGGIVWKDYLITAGVNASNNLSLDAFDLTSTWTNAFATSSTTSRNLLNKRPIPFFVHPSEADALYLGDDNFISRLTEDTNFDPTSGASFTFTEEALDLPEGFVIESLEQSTSNLLIGASVIGGSTFQNNQFNGQIFPWDRTSASFDTPLSLEAGGVRQLINVNNLFYLANGDKATYLKTNLSLVNDLGTIAPFRGLEFDAVGLFYDSAVDIFGGEILFGVSTADTDFTPAGVYGFKNGTWRFLEISTGSIGDSADLRIGAIYTKEDESTFLVAWEDDTTYGVDEFGQNGYRYTGYKAFVETQVYRVGGARNGKNYQYLDVVLNKDLTTGQGIKVSYRKGQNDSYTLMQTIDFATYGAIDHISLPAKLTSVEAQTIQFKIELTTGSSSTSTPELLSVIIS